MSVHIINDNQHTLLLMVPNAFQHLAEIIFRFCSMDLGKCLYKAGHQASLILDHADAVTQPLLLAALQQLPHQLRFTDSANTADQIFPSPDQHLPQFKQLLLPAEKVLLGERRTAKLAVFAGKPDNFLLFFRIPFHEGIAERFHGKRRVGSESAKSALPFSVSRQRMEHEQRKEPSTVKSPPVISLAGKLLLLCQCIRKISIRFLGKTLVPFRQQPEVSRQLLAEDLIIIITLDQRTHELLYLPQYRLLIRRIAELLRIFAVAAQTLAAVTDIRNIAVTPLTASPDLSAASAVAKIIQDILLPEFRQCKSSVVFLRDNSFRIHRIIVDRQKLIKTFQRKNVCFHLIPTCHIKSKNVPSTVDYIISDFLFQ